MTTNLTPIAQVDDHTWRGKDTYYGLAFDEDGIVHVVPKFTDPELVPAQTLEEHADEQAGGNDRSGFPYTGIADTTHGQCEARLSIKGEDFRCDLALDHNGWAHSSQGAEAIWTPAENLPPAVESALTDIVRVLADHGHQITQAEGEDGLADALAVVIEQHAGQTTLPAPPSLTRAQIAEQVRRHCTLPVWELSGDALIAAVADWIENPPEWVTLPSAPTTPVEG